METFEKAFMMMDKPEEPVRIASLNKYQAEAMVTAVFKEELKIVYPALGLNGEAGEVAEKVKKVLRGDSEGFTEDKCREIAKELGDCLWYVSVLANSIGYTLQEIAEMNINKLRSRQQRGRIGGSGDNR